MIKITSFLLNDKNARRWMPVFLVCALLGIFIVLTSEVKEALSGQFELIGKIDSVTLNYLLDLRSPLLSSVAIDITALGSGAVITILVLFFSAFWISLKEKYMAIQLLIVAVLSSFLTLSLKFYFERSRPEMNLHLIDVQGYSYPSGHSLFSSAIYFTIATLLLTKVSRRFSRVLLWSMFLLLIIMIGLTRIYLGVHYFSDVIAGILLGVATATIVEITMSFYIRRFRHEV